MTEKQSAHRKDWDPFFHEGFSGFSSMVPYWQKILPTFLERWPTVDDFNALRKHHPFEFVTQTKDMRYDTEIFRFNRIPTRSQSWHDFFNNLTWLIWPNLKRTIIDRIGRETHSLNSNARTPRQNLLTHFDECGIVICSHRPELFDDIKNFAWKKFFFDTKDLTEICEIYIIGHGLFEKGLSPYIGMTAKAIFLPIKQDFFAHSYEQKMDYIDQHIARYIASVDFPETPKSLTPFPFLGWPGWWPGNDVETFFDNEKYFRRREFGTTDPLPLLTVLSPSDYSMGQTA